jgi:isopenicillin N synthase-like dioxygenase
MGEGLAQGGISPHDAPKGAAMIPSIDAEALFNAAHPAHAEAVAEVRRGATEIRFLTLRNSEIGAAEVLEVIAALRAFFHLPAAEKQAYDMARTGSNRGWGASGGEQVDPEANPDYKQVYDCGFELDPADPVAALGLPAYAPNLWPNYPEGFAEVMRAYYARATGLALKLLEAIANAAGEEGAYFADKFTRPVALLRGNYYPERPAWATERDFGIATHTDYGCVTLLATDGVPGLEVRLRGGGWLPVVAEPGTFVINFGEMLEMWTGGRIVATPHRVKGSDQERISVPLFFNPNHDANVAPVGSGKVIRAVDHLQKRFNETYLHLKT